MVLYVNFEVDGRDQSSIPFEVKISELVADLKAICGGIGIDILASAPGTIDIPS
jgi:hypothetical protein